MQNRAGYFPPQTSYQRNLQFKKGKRWQTIPLRVLYFSHKKQIDSIMQYTFVARFYIYSF